MTLLVVSSAPPEECARAIEQATGEKVEAVRTLSRATAMLRGHEYNAVVIEQAAAEGDGSGVDALLSAAAPAIPVFVNLAISGAPRVAREVRIALQRREQEHRVARRAAETALRSELNEAVTGILLSSQLALAVPELPPAAEAKLRSVYHLAMSIRSRLEQPAG